MSVRTVISSKSNAQFRMVKNNIKHWRIQAQDSLQSQFHIASSGIEFESPLWKAAV
jgi:hypothetical protein